MIKKSINCILFFAIAATTNLMAQPVLETGGKRMPNEWIDKETGHKIIKLIRKEGNFASFYFHNNPFILGKNSEGDRMVFYGNDRYKGDGNGNLLYTVNLKDFSVKQLTFGKQRKMGEILAAKQHKVYFQSRDTVYAVNADNQKTEVVYVFPADFKGNITTINADETLLAGARSTDEEKEISRANPEKKDYFNKIYEAKLPRTLFTIDLKTKQLNKIFTDSAWLNHIQFSPTNPKLLMFCHEGPWHKVDRIWTIDIDTKNVQLIHKRTIDMEIAGHEWFDKRGNIIWFDLQMPRGENFFVAGVDLQTMKEKRYRLERNEWSVHYTSSNDAKLFAGDGGDENSVAKAPDGKWIYLFKPNGDHFVSEKLVSMKYHKYKFEPNVHFSPDQKWIIFRANFEGNEQIYAVEIQKRKK